ncbi:MAG: SDR family NAD(P)-dependent oxidoreductase [Dehalococcoidia bacterium]|nr:SDR family NAD(P)-dependent oxidoreductase [Dehalococcoidia bacterium]
MAKHLEGKNAVVTGAGRGIGRAVALELAKQGAKVVVCDLGGSKSGEGADAGPAQQVVAEIEKAGGTAIANNENVTDFAAAERIVKMCVDSFGRIDILVNCAGILRDRMTFNMTEQEWDAVIAVHLKGMFNMCRHASRLMREQKWGRIVSTTSDAWRGAPGQGNYSAAKGGITSLTYTLAGELGKYNVTVNAIAPIAATRMTMDDEVKARFKRAYESGMMSKEQYEEVINMPGPEYVAPTVAYLCSEEGKIFNGKVIGVQGGRVAVYSKPFEIAGLYRDIRKEGPWTVDELIRLAPTLASVPLNIMG